MERNGTLSRLRLGLPKSPIDVSSPDVNALILYVDVPPLQREDLGDPQRSGRADPFLPLCPITSRYNVIPAGYNGRLHADPSHDILVDQITVRMRSLLTRRGLRKTRSFEESARKFLRFGKSKPCPGAIQLHRRRSPRC